MGLRRIKSLGCLSFWKRLKDQWKFFVRVGMMNPDTIMPVLKELIEAYKSPKLFKFLHIPVQSGNDRVLKMMGRKYTVLDFKRCSGDEEGISELSISTDIIVGFPGESEEEFMDSMRLLEWLKPDVLNLSRFTPRPGTAAAGMEGQLKGEVTKERSERMAKLFGKILDANNRGWLGWEGEVYADERGKNESFMARNYAYKPVVIKTKEDIRGRFLRVKIRGTSRYYIEGKLQE
jgi:tRNA A37 methylthiotransferase MiaB